MGLIKSVEGEGKSVKGFGDGFEMRRRVKLRQWRWVRVNRLSFSNGGWCVMLTLMLGGVWVRREERADGDTEIQRTKREKRTEVANSGERNFGGKKGWNNFFFFFFF